MHVHQYLQCQCQANEVHHYLFICQFHTEKAQQSEKGLVVLPTAAMLLTAQVDVSVQLLAVLRVEDPQGELKVLQFFSSYVANVNIYLFRNIWCEYELA